MALFMWFDFFRYRDEKLVAMTKIGHRDENFVMATFKPPEKEPIFKCPLLQTPCLEFFSPC